MIGAGVAAAHEAGSAMGSERSMSGAWCLSCGYDLSRTRRAEPCPECGLASEASRRLPLSRWVGAQGVGPLLNCLGLASRAMISLGVGCVALGAAIAMVFHINTMTTGWPAVYELIARSLAVFAATWWIAFALLGLMACAALMRLKQRRSEPRGLREARIALMWYAAGFPVIWIIAAVVGTLLTHVFQPLITLFVPANGFLIGVPLALSSAWCKGVRSSVTRGRESRRRVLRRRYPVGVMIGLWALVAAAATIPAYLMGEGNDITPRYMMCVVLVGGASYSAIALHCARQAWGLRRLLLTIIERRQEGAGKAEGAGRK